MDRKLKQLMTVIIVSSVAIFFTACNKNPDGGDDYGSQAHLEIFLTDDPADYDEVNINIQSVEIHTNDGGWKTYHLIHPGIYDLLQFNSGVDTLMISEDISPATVSQIRLILGDGSNVVVDGITYPLETPSAEESGLKLNVHYTFEAGIAYKLWLDFDAERSIVQHGNGDYSLKPVIRVFTEEASGAISGTVSPVGGSMYVMAVMDGDTSGTTTEEDGSFLIGGLIEGNYDVVFEPEPGFLEVTVPDVHVETGVVTDIGVVIIPL